MGSNNSIHSIGHSYLLICLIIALFLSWRVLNYGINNKIFILESLVFYVRLDEWCKMWIRLCLYIYIYLVQIQKKSKWLRFSLSCRYFICCKKELFVIMVNLIKCTYWTNVCDYFFLLVKPFNSRRSVIFLHIDLI